MPRAAKPRGARRARWPWMLAWAFVGASAHAARVHVLGPAALIRNPPPPATPPLPDTGGCTLYGKLGRLSGGTTLPAITAADLQNPPADALGSVAVTAAAAGAALRAALPRAVLPAVAAGVPRNGSTLFRLITDNACMPGSPFTATLRSSPAGSGGQVVAVSGIQQITATYTVQETYDANNPYDCSSGAGRRRRHFLCNLWSIVPGFDFLSASFAAQGAGNYTLTLVRATVTSP